MHMSKKLQRRLQRIILGGIIYAAMIIAENFASLNIYVELAGFLAAYLIVGGDVLKRAFQNITRGKIFDENFLMMIATIGAFLLGEYPEGVAVMLFYQIGEFFQSYAVNKSRKSISDLMDICPESANRKTENGVEEVEPEEIVIGDILIIRPGEKVPVDGIIIEGNSTMDTKALTGEAMPRDVTVGDMVISGCINQKAVLEVKASKEYEDSTVAKVLELVENAGNRKAETENFISRFAKYYTPVVVIAAALLALIPPLVLQGGWNTWVYRALSFLVISCPCALVISVPLSFFGGIGGASRQGILVKGSNYLEALAKAELAVFDKTGTLTKGNFRVTQIDSIGMSEEELLEYAAYAESRSTHPISVSLCQRYGKKIDDSAIGAIEEIAGHGIQAMIRDKEILAGNEKLMRKFGINFKANEAPGSVVYVAVDKTFAGTIVVTDEIKEDAAQTIRELKATQIKKCIMLTGDNNRIGKYVGETLHLDEVYTELLPGDKVDKVEELLGQTSENRKLFFVGDGMNDAPVLARADIGIVMGGLGSDAAIEAADIVIMNDEPSKILKAIAISKKTLKIVKSNIIFAIGIKVLILLLAMFGIASMWAAVFADVGVAFIAILNAMRAGHVK